MCALAAAAYLSLMGRQGLRELAARNVELAHQAKSALEAVGVRRRFAGHFFNEFTVVTANPEATLEVAERHGVLAGLALARDYPDLRETLLISVTEMNTSADIARLCEVLAEAR